MSYNPQNRIALDKWTQYIEERAQELGHEITFTSDHEFNFSPIEMSMALVIPCKYAIKFRIELYTSIRSSNSIMRICLIRNVAILKEERMFHNRGEKIIKKSIERIFEEIKQTS